MALWTRSVSRQGRVPAPSRRSRPGFHGHDGAWPCRDRSGFPLVREWHGAVGLGVSGPAEVAQSYPLYGSRPAAGQDRLRFCRMVVRRLDHTREQKGYDNGGGDCDDCWGSRWKPDTPNPLAHLRRSFQGIGSYNAIIASAPKPGCRELERCAERTSFWQAEYTSPTSAWKPSGDVKNGVISNGRGDRRGFPSPGSENGSQTVPTL
jgi:hypothetical protein